jgi:hypothetical protein
MITTQSQPCVPMAVLSHMRLAEGRSNAPLSEKAADWS